MERRQQLWRGGRSCRVAAGVVEVAGIVERRQGQQEF